MLRIDIIDPAGPIPHASVEQMFEPLFTTKESGNGRGPAIACNIVRAHRSHVLLRNNEPGVVCFSIEIPARAPD